MAVRYSGDVEARASYRPEAVVVVLRWPERGRVRRSTYVERGHRFHPTSNGYDEVVRAAIRDLLRARPSLPVERGILGRLVLRRVFQAPCPR